MFFLKKRKEIKKYDYELKSIDEEINRSKRYNLKFCLLAVELSHSVPRGLSRILPGDVLSFHVVKKYIRSYDKVFGPHSRRYFIILPQTDENEANVVKQRVQGLANKYSWGEVYVGMAVFPDSGEKALELFDTALNDMLKP